MGFKDTGVMKIVQWNFSREIDLISGVKRYEDALFDNLKKEYPALEVKRIYRRSGRFGGSMPVSWFLRPETNGADIVHATLQTFAPIALFKKPRNFIVTVQDLIPMIYPSTIRDTSTRLQWLFTPGALKKVDHIIAISEFVKREIVRILAIDPFKISVVIDGVDHSLYKPLDKPDCKRKFNLNVSEKHILVVASNEQHKRMDLVVKVFNEIKKQRNDVKLIKIGYGQLLQGEGVINPGWVAESDMPLLYNAADIFLHTAEYEGFGLPILEAMACGTPVVVSKKASIPEIVGDCGEMIDLDSEICVQDFVQAILKNIDHYRDLKAVERSKLFQWEYTARDTVNVYNKVLKS
jgi:glycosyltransferase involved in cell wall biosynthesis